ncbi:DNA sulfur modification protein DndD [Phormidium sp. CCY1219]|uniref:DNA sulfur modification protein DndD n=1 Tax=Phormidium sp. CCY1219 TaxID=2886104 RepID=UPI002D1F7CE6|nr:DNA sulfur modification protein DndD [Phormidium sp. CCY1219]MEB3827549.1 DNA sulfur modification protein DndD [Phormidium sp. CCY1219]
MIFTELVLQNFGPYLGRQVIDLRPQFKDQLRPIILFGGMNGGGKTTLMDAIRLALYGQRAQCSTRGNLSYNDFLVQCVNRNKPPMENTRIELVFEHVEDDQILELRVVRYWDKNPKDGKDTLGVLEGDWPRTDLRDTWDEYIENMLPLGISNLFLFDGEQVKELAEQETPPPVVVEAIQSLLGLELAERLSIDLDILVSRKRKKLANESERQSLEEIEERLSRYQEEYEAAKQDLGALQGKVKYAEKNQRKAWDKFVSEGGKIASERTQLEKQKRNLQEQLDSLREELGELAAGVLPLVMIQPLLAEALLQGEKEAKHQQAKISRDVVKERSDRLLAYLAEINLTSEQIDKIQFFLEQEDKDLSSHLAAEEDLWLSADEDTLSIIANLLRHHLGDRVKYTLTKLQKRKTIEQEITFTERQLAAAASPEIYQQLEQAVRDTEAALVDAKTNYETGRRRHDELERNIKGVKKELAEYSAVNIDRQNDEHIIQSANKVQETLKVFRERLTLRKLNKLESEVTECFLYLLHKSDLVNRVVIDTHSFSLSLFDMEGKPVPKHRLSAGEKQLLAIAFLWGLARVSGRQLPVAIDTPLGRLDSSHRHNLVERYFPSASHQVILLSTDTEIGKVEVENLREHEALSHEYLLKYQTNAHKTVVENGYFW